MLINPKAEYYLLYILTNYYLCIMEAKGVIHLEIKAIGVHRYFGSPSAMYDNYTSQDLGIARQSLLNYWQKTEEPYENSICIIRKGELERKTKIKQD